jgi:hypothetical protein
MGDRNLVRIGRPAKLHSLAEFVPWNRFLGSLKVSKFGLCLFLILVSAEDPYPVDALPYCTHAQDVCNSDKECKEKVSLKGLCNQTQSTVRGCKILVYISLLLAYPK